MHEDFMVQARKRGKASFFFENFEIFFLKILILARKRKGFFHHCCVDVDAESPELPRSKKPNGVSQRPPSIDMKPVPTQETNFNDSFEHEDLGCEDLDEDLGCEDLGTDDLGTTDIVPPNPPVGTDLGTRRLGTPDSQTQLFTPKPEPSPCHQRKLFFSSPVIYMTHSL